jgi:hypothetical protein
MDSHESWHSGWAGVDDLAVLLSACDKYKVGIGSCLGTVTVK